MRGGFIITLDRQEVLRLVLGANKPDEIREAEAALREYLAEQDDEGLREAAERLVLLKGAWDMDDPETPLGANFGETPSDPMYHMLQDTGDQIVLAWDERLHPRGRGGKFRRRFVRLYRGERLPTKGWAAGRSADRQYPSRDIGHFYTDDPEKARAFAREGGRVFYIDVPESKVKDYARQYPGEFLVPEEVARQRKQLPTHRDRLHLPPMEPPDEPSPARLVRMADLKPGDVFLPEVAIGWAPDTESLLTRMNFRVIFSGKLKKDDPRLPSGRLGGDLRAVHDDFYLFLDGEGKSIVLPDTEGYLLPPDPAGKGNQVITDEFSQIDSGNAKHRLEERIAKRLVSDPDFLAIHERWKEKDYQPWRGEGGGSWTQRGKRASFLPSPFPSPVNSVESYNLSSLYSEGRYYKDPVVIDDIASQIEGARKQLIGLFVGHGDVDKDEMEDVFPPVSVDRILEMIEESGGFGWQDAASAVGLSLWDHWSKAWEKDSIEQYATRRGGGLYQYVAKGDLDSDLDAVSSQVINAPVNAVSKVWKKDLETDPEFFAYSVGQVLIDQWANTANSNSPLSLAMQDVADKEFELGEVYHNPGVALNIPGSLKSMMSDYPPESEFVENYWSTEDEHGVRGEDGQIVAHRFIRAMYEETQQRFKELEIKHLRLYRGMTMPYPEEPIAMDRDADVMLRSLSSFSVSRGIAQHFTGTGGGEPVVLEADVPVERVISSAVTGYGSLSEEEVVVLGGPRNRVRVTPGYGTSGMGYG